MKNETTLKQVALKAKENHIWLNAFQCINPSDEFLKTVGKMVLSKLDDKDALLKRKSTLSEMLYLSINKS